MIEFGALSADDGGFAFRLFLITTRNLTFEPELTQEWTSRHALDPGFELGVGLVRGARFLQLRICSTRRHRSCQLSTAEESACYDTESMQRTD